MKTIVGVGGTGQMMLHYYFQLYLVGVIKDPFQALVIDTDEIMPSLQVISDFLELLQYGRGRTEAFGVRIPTLEKIDFQTPFANDVFHLMTGIEAANGNALHPVRAFYSRDALSQNVQEGLFARPALSSSLSQDVLSSPHLKPDREDGAVIIVGSFIGGTGGGLIAPILDAFHQNASRFNRTAKLRAVLFGEFFSVDPTRIQGGQARIQSNQTLALRSLEEARTKLHSFYIVGGPGQRLVERKPNEEKKANNLLFPDSDHPYWEGLQALQYLIPDTVQDTVPEGAPFAQREVPTETIQVSISHNLSRQRMQEAVVVANTLVRRKVIPYVAREPWVDAVWGKELKRFVAHFWRIGARIAGEEQQSNFPDMVQSALKKIWFGDGKYGLYNMFPTPIKKLRISPSDYHKIAWPETEQLPHNPLFEGDQMAARRAAATSIFWALREGLRSNQ